jgi:phage tail sheath protein FI
LPESKVLSFVVAEGPGADQPIARLPGAVTAFVGRTVRGPVNQPLLLDSFADYQQVFGGLWQPSPLSYAVEQYFENGGRQAVVVRVVNGGAPATMSLPCGGETLTLEAQSPGSRETLRASIDYDNIGPAEEKRFNLVVQRLRAAGSEHIEDQEIFRRVSVEPDTARFVATALQESTLVRVRGPVPSRRPDRTFRAGSRHPIGYVDSNPDGDDGEPLTDYDIIGSQQRGTGLFALRGTDFVNFVCVPPLARDRDIGPSALVVATRLCRDLRALLIVDPPSEWSDPAQALRGLRDLALQTEDALMCFPRVLAYDRLRGRYETFANCGAVAGVLARLEEQRPWWQPGPDEEILLRPGTRPVRMLNDAERARLAMHGINPLQSLRSANPRPLPLRTLAQGAAASTDGGWLAARRRWLQLMNSLERGTRWVLYDVRDRNSWSRMRGQAEAFLQPLADAGLFGDGPADAAFKVICDERLNSEDDRAAGQVHMLVSLRTTRQSEYRSFLITHGVQGSRVRPVRSNVLPAGLRLSIAASATEEVVDVVVEHDVTADLEATEPRVALPRSAAPPDDPTTPVETLPPASVSPDRADDATTLVAQQLEHRADSTTVVAVQPDRTDDSTTLVLPLTEGAAPGGLDRDDIARFYRDFGGPGQQL